MSATPRSLIMPNRILREGILTSETVSELGWAEEVFYRRLMSVADDHGRYHALPKLLRSACYPLQIDKVSDADIGKWTTKCVAAGLVSVYPAQDGKRYLQIVKFGQQVRAKSKFPEPAHDFYGEHSIPDENICKQVIADAHLDGGVVGDEGEGERAGTSAEKRKARSPSGSRLPADWSLPDDWRKWAAAERQDLDIGKEAEKFADYWHAKPGKDGRKADWRATWRNWIRNGYGANGRAAPAREPAPLPRLQS